MHPNENRRKIKNILIRGHTSFQLRYTFWCVIAALLLGGMNLYTLNKAMQDVASTALTNGMAREAQVMLWGQFSELVWKLSFQAVLFSVGLAVFGIFITHRTAGPLYHFQRVFSEIRRGNRSARVKLRPNDEFRAVADEFNAMVDELSQK